jgi:hypothetical protein
VGNGNATAMAMAMANEMKMEIGIVYERRQTPRVGQTTRTKGQEG